MFYLANLKSYWPRTVTLHRRVRTPPITVHPRWSRTPPPPTPKTPRPRRPRTPPPPPTPQPPPNPGGVASGDDFLKEKFTRGLKYIWGKFIENSSPIGAMLGVVGLATYFNDSEPEPELKKTMVEGLGAIEDMMKEMKNERIVQHDEIMESNEVMIQMMKKREVDEKESFEKWFEFCREQRKKKWFWGIF